MHECYICRSKNVVDVLDLGPQPISNRFLKKTGLAEYRAPLGISQCQACGLVQITQPVPAAELRPSYDWITYNEPEPHLDRLAKVVSDLPGLTPSSRIWGVSFKDDSLLGRLGRLGYSNTHRLDPANDLKIDHKGAGVESVQERINSRRSTDLIKHHGRPDVIIARHIIEHAHHIGEFIMALLSAIPPQGYLVLEAPDCQRAFDLLDYTTIWEEHTLYFSPQTFQSMFQHFNLDLVYSEVFPYAFENSLVGIGRVNSSIKNDNNNRGQRPNRIKEELGRMQRFAKSFPEFRRNVDAYLKKIREEQGEIALFGAGHLACAFINYLSIDDHFSFVADDNPHKQGLFMPGSGLPIFPSATLITEKIHLCLFSLSPELEDRVIEKNQGFLQQGGHFASIFPASKRAINYNGE